MKRIPESFVLDENDIRLAITYWLKLAHNIRNNADVSVEFKTENKETPPVNGPIGGMSEPIITTVVTAVASVKEAAK